MLPCVGAPGRQLPSQKLVHTFPNLVSAPRCNRTRAVTSPGSTLVAARTAHRAFRGARPRRLGLPPRASVGGSRSGAGPRRGVCATDFLGTPGRGAARARRRALYRESAPATSNDTHNPGVQLRLVLRLLRSPPARSGLTAADITGQSRSACFSYSRSDQALPVARRKTDARISKNTGLFNRQGSECLGGPRTSTVALRSRLGAGDSIGVCAEDLNDGSNTGEYGWSTHWLEPHLQPEHCMLVGVAPPHQWRLLQPLPRHRHLPLRSRTAPPRYGPAAAKVLVIVLAASD